MSSINATLAPAACGAYIDPLAIPPVSRILGMGSYSFLYNDAQLACLLAGLVALVLILGTYCCGCACRCFRDFDVFSREFFIDAAGAGGAAPGADARDADGGDDARLEWGPDGPADAGGAPKAVAVPRVKKLGGVALWAGIAIGAALSGDVLAWISADTGCVASARTRPAKARRLIAPVPAPYTLRARAASCRRRWRPRRTRSPSRARARPRR